MSMWDMCDKWSLVPVVILWQLLHARTLSYSMPNGGRLWQLWRFCFFLLFYWSYSISTVKTMVYHTFGNWHTWVQNLRFRKCPITCLHDNKYSLHILVWYCRLWNMTTSSKCNVVSLCNGIEFIFQMFESNQQGIECFYGKAWSANKKNL